MIDRDELHRLVDQLPKEELRSAERYLRYLRDQDPVLRAFYNAPIDDEPETEEERLAVEEAKAEMARGEGIPWEQVQAELEALARSERAARRSRRKAS